uniref:Uncharacterized protein n=1 Tax=Arundo donax TaxID=35708 RepID=A0A0A9BJ10_ARUDO
MEEEHRVIRHEDAGEVEGDNFNKQPRALATRSSFDYLISCLDGLNNSYLVIVVSMFHFFLAGTMHFCL